LISAGTENAISITDTNFTELQRLCEDFGFSKIAGKLSEFHPLMDLKEAKTETEDADARGRIAVHGEKANQHSHVIVMLRCCRTKSLSCSTILGVSSVKFQHFDLLQREFKHFGRHPPVISIFTKVDGSHRSYDYDCTFDR
jgi:hypothetical protein